MSAQIQEQKVNKLQVKESHSVSNDNKQEDYTDDSKLSCNRDTVYMRKLQLMNKGGKQDNSQENINQLHVDIQKKATTPKRLSVSHMNSSKWEELIITGRNIQNRSVFASVVHNNFLYVYGGYEINAGILSDFHRIDLSKKTYIWQSITGKNPKSSPGKLCRQSGVLYKNKMYMLGGQYVGSMNSNRMFSYDFLTEMWEEILYSGDVQFPCIDSHKAVIYNDKMIVLSGYLGKEGRYNEAVYSFEFTTLKWKLLSPNSSGILKLRIGTDIALYKDTIFLFGGYDGSDRLNDLYSFDIPTQRWAVEHPNNPESIPKTRKGHSLSLYGDHLILFGGIHDVTWELDDLLAYDITNKVWKTIEEDSARRNDYQNLGDVSPTKNKVQQRTSSFKRSANHSATQKRSMIMSSPLKTQNSGISPGLSPQSEKRSPTKQSTKLNFMMNSTNQGQVDPYYVVAEHTEGPQSPTRNLETQKKKEFFQRKADMLAMLYVNPEEEDNMRNNSNSPTSEAMKNALITIGNPMPEIKPKKGKTTDFGRTTFSKFLEPIRSSTNSKVGKKPCARDGHIALINNSKLFIFGGDRHKMSFNDIFALDLEKCL